MLGIRQSRDRLVLKTIVPLLVKRIFIKTAVNIKMSAYGIGIPIISPRRPHDRRIITSYQKTQFLPRSP